MYVLIYDIGFSLSDLLHSVTVSRFIHFSQWTQIHSFSQLNNIPLCIWICTTISSFVFIFYYSLFYVLSVDCAGPLLKHELLSSCNAQASHRGGFSCCRARALGHEGSVAVAPGLNSTDSIAVVHGLGCSAVCGVSQDSGSNPRLLHWQVDSWPLGHEGSPVPQLLYPFTSWWVSRLLLCPGYYK